MEKPSLTDKVSEGAAAESLKCPQCGSKRLYKDGLRPLPDGSSVQRWLCRECGLRFSEKPLLKVTENKIPSMNSFPIQGTFNGKSAPLQWGKRLLKRTKTPFEEG
jgi:predicted RNA-binding Zn-ribbon protein involved in translation (DUF1610 family)